MLPNWEVLRSWSLRIKTFVFFGTRAQTHKPMQWINATGGGDPRRCIPAITMQSQTGIVHLHHLLDDFIQNPGVATPGKLPGKLIIPFDIPCKHCACMSMHAMHVTTKVRNIYLRCTKIYKLHEIKPKYFRINPGEYVSNCLPPFWNALAICSFLHVNTIAVHLANTLLFILLNAKCENTLTNNNNVILNVFRSRSSTTPYNHAHFQTTPGRSNK